MFIMTDQPPAPKFTYVDRPEITEVFVDAVEKLRLDGGVARLELVVNRLDQVVPPNTASGTRTTAARLVIPLGGIVDLANKLNSLMNAIRNQQKSMAAAANEPPPKIQ
jgi:hypothetical protein